MTPDSSSAPPIFELFSIGFGGPGGSALAMRDLLTEVVLGATPEWVANHRSAPIAFAQGATVMLDVVFQASNIDVFPSGASYTVQATGDLFNVTPQAVPLSIQPMDGFSAPIGFTLSTPVPDGIGVRTFSLEWTATDPNGQTFGIGTSTHELYVTWRPLEQGTDLIPPIIPYDVVVRMAVSWCAGQTTLDGICTALCDQMQHAGILHSITNADVQMVLLQRTADSGGFAALLGQLLDAHGIGSATRAFSIDWARLPDDCLGWVPTASTADTFLVVGRQIHTINLIASESAVLLCDGDAGVGPVTFPGAMPLDTAWTMTGAPFAALRQSYLVPAAQRVNGRLVGLLPTVPLTPFAIHFAFDGSDAIVLHDPVTDDRIGKTAEWIAGTSGLPGDARSSQPAGLPAAFVRGTVVTLSVRFRRTIDVQHGGKQTMTVTLGASGTPVGVTEQTVTLTFTPSGRSQAVRFQTDAVVSNDVGMTTLDLEWYAIGANGARNHDRDQRAPAVLHLEADRPRPRRRVAGLGLRPARPVDVGVRRRRDLGQRGVRPDHERLPETGLKYGVAGWTPRQMLLGNGGMCGGWYQLFQAMLHCQGVTIQKRAFLVDWRTLAASDVAWNAIVVSSGGLNQKVPPVTPSVFHDVSAFPIASTAGVTTLTAQRYRFWGMPGGWSDGHCVNFATFDGQLYLYDASFHLGPIALDMPMPPADGTVLGGSELADFVAKYLSVAVSHMLGSFTVDTRPTSRRSRSARQPA